MKKWNWKLIGISLAILAVVVVVSMLIFPQWITQLGIGGAILGIIVIATPEIVDFLSKAKKLYKKDEDEDSPKTAEVHTEGGDYFTGNKIIQGDDKRMVINAKDNATVQQIENQTNIYNPDNLALASLHQLPAPPQDFTGREEELDALCRAVQHEGVLLSGLRGMGGVDKTALALVLAQRLAPNYPDAQLFIDMYGAPGTPTQPTTPAAAMQQVIRAFYPQAKLPEDGNQLTAQYRSVLHDKKALILLDDARDAAQVEPLLPPPSCLLLVTTRQRFTLPGLKELDLDTLSEAEAIRLIEKITSRAGEKAGEIAKACGYLPLALRLAASALREQANLNAAALLARLNDAEKRFTTLAKVKAAIQVSYDLLPEDLQTTLRQLAVFPADFDQPAAAAVWDADEDTTQERLAVLINASLVAYDPNTARYRLHDLVRAVAENLLNEEEKNQASYRHAAHYLEVLDRADDLYQKSNKQTLAGLTLFDLEWPHIKAGQSWASAHTAQDEQAARLCTDYPILGAYPLYLRLHPSKQIDWLEDALSAANVIGDRRGEGKILGNLGNAFENLSLFQQAIEQYHKHLEIAREIGDRQSEGHALGNLGNAYHNLGQLQTAIDFYQQAIVICHEIGDLRGEGNSIGNLGVVYKDLNQFEEAIYCHKQALAISRNIGDRLGEAIALSNLGFDNRNLNQIHDAIHYHKQALELSRKIKDKRREAKDLGGLAIAYGILNQYQQSFEYFNQQISISQELGDRLDEKRAGWNLGLMLIKQGELQKALPLMQIYIDFLNEISHPDAENMAEQVEKLKKQLLRQSGNQ